MKILGYIGVAVVAGLLVFGGSLISKTTVIQQTDNLGSLTSPDIKSLYLCVNDLCTYSTSIPMKTATTTLCAIQSPAATSTLAYASIKLTTATSTITKIQVSQAATSFASTTSMGLMTIPATESALFTASTTDNGSNDRADENFIFPPQYWLNVTIENTMKGGANTAGYVPSGTCKAEFKTL